MFVQLQKEFQGNQPGRRIDVSVDVGERLIQKGIAERLADDPLEPVVHRTVEQVKSQLTDGITSALQQFTDAQSQARRHSQPAIFGGSTKGNPHHCFGDWLLHVARNDESYLEKNYQSFRAKGPMAESSGTTGGYLVPQEFHEGIMRVVAEHTFLRKRAFVQPMASAALMFPYLDVTTLQSSGVSPFFGGVQMYWTEEAQNRTETEPQFKMMELKAHELSGHAVSSNVLLQDSGVGLEKFLLTLFGQAVGWFEEYAFLQGDGVGKPLGILNAPAAIAINRGTANEVNFNDVATMLSRLLPSSQKRAVWVIHPYVLAQLVQLADSGGHIIWVPNNGGVQDHVPGTLFGLPVVTTEKVPALGTKGDCMLIDPQFYVIGDRMHMEIAASEHVNFLKNQVTWRIVQRVDGQPWLEKSITLQDAASTVSPFVILN